ncbi:hypothetical protein BDZ45DRAFT_655569 [Acephala macrosclerotiorum]|nr:hypothetical protein BDZ45DRAFT_655569 [Acephala macrosclerotiorum]
MSSSTVTRKRSRASLLEPDELSPEKAPLSSAKKRKLNAYAHTPSPAKGFGAAIRRTLGGFVGYGKSEKENATQEEDEEDELAQGNGDEVDDNEATNDKPEKDIYDFESSSPEDNRTKRRHGSERSRVPSKPGTAEKAKGRSSGKKAKATTDEVSGDIWEVPDEDSTPQRPIPRITKITSTAERVKAKLKPVAQESDSPKRGPGRPSKSKLLKESKKLGRQDARERITAAAEEEDEEEDEDEEISTPARRKNRRAQKDEEAEPMPNGENSTRKRGRPRKVVEEIQATKQVPKGILTPSKGKTPRPRKSVVFEETAEVDLGFKDIDTTSTKKAKRVNKPIDEPEAVADSEESTSEVEYTEPTVVEDVDPVEENDSEDSDDEACAICGGLNSTKKNQIIFCDGCDFMVHQKCYDIREVPKGDWFCRKCQPDVNDEALFPQLVNKPAVDLPDIEGFTGHLKQMQRVLLDRLTGQKRIKLRGHDEEMQKVHQIVEQTVLAGEGNSMLVIGARGCGKTTLVESVISDLSSDHREKFHVIRLNGFIHTDDKLALKEIWRQLGREMEVEEDPSNKTSNYADTLASLLALLSHPGEHSESQSNETTKSVIFILDEFDLFTTHPRQTLLYNLFDIAQAKKAPIAVLGLTTRIDVMDSFEKRVKSRFSHRYVHLSLPRSLPAYWEICKQGLIVDTEEAEADGFESSVPGQDEFRSFWNTMIEELYNKDTTFKQHIQSEFYRTKSVPGFFSSCILPVSSLSPKKFKLDGHAFASGTMSLAPPDSKLQTLQGLSELELALLIAAARLDIILDTDTCNFAMAYDEYSSLTSRHKIQTSSSGVNALGSSAKVWGRDVALGAWERLAEYDLLVPAGMGAGVKDSGTAGRMWRVDVGLEEITGSVDSISTVMAKWCREI